MQRRRKKSSQDILINIKVGDGDGRMWFEIDDKLEAGIERFVKLCNEKFTIIDILNPKRKKIIRGK